MKRSIGMDMGYGFIKTTDGRDGYVFPSVVGEGGTGPSGSFGFARPSVTDNIRFTMNGRSVFLGDLAIRHSRIAHRGLSATRSEGDDIQALFLGALSLYCTEQMNDFDVVTGLPPGRMHLEDELVRKLKGDHSIQRPARNGSQDNISIRVASIQVVPQPLGAYWAEVLDQRGQMRSDSNLLSGKIGVIDVGFRTSDFATIVDGEYAPAWSRTVPLGISTGYDGIADALATEFGLERETYTLDDAVIEGKVSVSGRETDITELRDRILGEVATKLYVEAQSLWQVAEYDRILVTGGGGFVLNRYLRPHVPQVELVSDPVTANARGYLAWALYQQQGAQPQPQPQEREQPSQPRESAFDPGASAEVSVSPEMETGSTLGPSPYEPKH